MRITAVEIRVEVNGDLAGHLRIENPDVKRKEQTEVGPGRVRLELVVEGREVKRIGPRFSRAPRG